MDTQAPRASGVVVGVDGSRSALRAVRWAAREAASRGVPLSIVHASPHYLELGPGTGHREWPLATQVAHGLVGRARHVAQTDQPGLTVETSVVIGPPARTLVEASGAAALLVVAARGLDGFAGLYLGSVAVTVSAYAACPVVVVRRSAAHEVGHSAPVVVGVDGSAGSQFALGFAFAFAARRRLPLVAVHSWRPLSPHSVRQTLAEHAGSQELAERTLDEAVAGWPERYPEVAVSRIVRRDRPVDVLLSFSPDAELLVVGSRGHGGFTGMLLGSTSESLIRYANGPVAVAHPGVRVREFQAEHGTAAVDTRGSAAVDTRGSAAVDTRGSAAATT